jgi:hypothetical protein
MKMHQLSSKPIKCSVRALEKSILDLQILSLDVARFSEAVLESLDHMRNACWGQ